MFSSHQFNTSSSIELQSTCKIAGVYFEPSKGAQYYVSDWQGNNVGVIDNTGKLVESTTYYPYGEPTIEPSGQRFLYGGKEREYAGGRNSYDFSARCLISPLGQWCVPDRKAEKFYPYSPYSYCAGDPINYIDPDGNELTILDEENDNVRHIRMRITGIVYNASQGEYDLTKLAKAIETQLNDVYTFTVNDLKVTMQAEVRVAKTSKEISYTDHLFAIVDQKILGNNVLGRAKGLGVELGTKLIDQTLDGSNTRSISHEVGHTIGLRDVNLERNTLQIENKGVNLMTQIRELNKNIDKNSAILLEKIQINEIVEKYNSGKLNQLDYIQFKHCPPSYNTGIFLLLKIINK